MDNDEMMKNSIRRAGRAKPGYGSNSSYQPSKGTSDENNPYMGPSPGPFMDIPPKEHQAGSGGSSSSGGARGEVRPRDDDKVSGAEDGKKQRKD